jgi:hypothetical protein
MSSAIAAAMAAMQALGAQGAPAGVGAAQQQALMAAALALEAQKHGYGAPLPALLAQAQAGFGVAPPAVPPRGGGGGVAATPAPGTRRARADIARARSAARGGGLGATAAPAAARTPGANTISEAQAGAFQERVIRWAAEKRDELRRRAEAEASKKLAACTFKPEINETSRQVAQTSRRASSAHPAEIYDRLYAQAAARAAARTPGKGLAAGGGGSPGSGGGGGASLRGESPVDPECTFQPKINESRDARPVSSRYLEPRVAPARAAAGAASEPGFSFIPKTNPVRPGVMPSAAMYVQAPIYERLARTNTRSQVERERQVAADLERMEAAAREKLGGAGGEGGAAGGAGASAAGSLPDLSAEEQQRLASFLARQEAAAERKRKHLEKLEKETAPELKPELCERSRKLVEATTSNASFLERLQRNMVEKEEEVRCGARAPSRPSTPPPLPTTHSS